MKYRLAIALHNESGVLLSMNRPDEARELLDQSIDMIKKILLAGYHLLLHSVPGNGSCADPV